MYRLRNLPLGALALENPETGTRLSVYPDYGLALNELTLKKEEELYSLLWHSDEEKSFQERQILAFSGAQLWPFPNRINNASYVYQGENYRLPPNDPGRPHSLHGLIYNARFELISYDEKEGKMKWSRAYAADDPGYPFHGTLIIDLSLSEDEMRVKSTIVNTSKVPMPMGYGWHPYFCLRKPSEWQLKIAGDEYFQTDLSLIPTMTTAKDQRFQKLESLGEHEMNHCYKVSPNGNRAESVLYNPEIDLSICLWQTAREKGLNYVQYYRPPESEYIAIEPMSCPPDVLNNNYSLIELEPAEELSFSWGIKIN